jgi:dTDP-4-dehydrorhamnose 3,5-epimerase
MTLKPSTLVFYKVDRGYSPEHEVGVLWNDPALGIDWPLRGGTPILSPKDGELPPLSQLEPL